MYNFIAIEGNIGAGKTSLALKLSEDFKAKLILEEFNENLFLPKFYKNKKRYAFPLEISFLAERYNQLSRTIFNQELFKLLTISDYFVIKSLIFSKINLEKDQYMLVKELFKIMYRNLPKPDLMVYLHARPKKLKSQIDIRGRKFESAITNSYLKKIEEGYLKYIKQQKDFPVLVINTDKLDFIKNEKDYLLIKSFINKKYTKGLYYR